MKISLVDKSVFVKWRRISISGEVAALRHAQAVLTQAGVPHILGSYYPCKSSLEKKRAEEAAEPWLLVPMDKFSDACSILFPVSEISRGQGAAGQIAARRR